GPGLLDQPLLDAHVDERALAADAVPIHDVELGLLERRGHLFLYDLYPRAVAPRAPPPPEPLRCPPLRAHPRAEHSRLATRRRLRRAEHDTDLLPELVDEDRRGAGVAERAGDLAQCLAHQPGLQADMAVTHLALDLGARHERRNRVDDDDVQRPG